MKEYKIFHIITGLKVGGAENALLRLILHSPDNYKHIVLSLTKGGAMHDVFLKSKIFSPPYPNYTKLLLSSVPEMDPDWLTKLLKKRTNKN